LTTAYIIHLANYSDGVLYALGFLLFLALAVMIDRFWSLRRTILGGDRIVRKTGGHAALGYGELEQLKAAAGRLPEGAVLDAALRHLDTARGEALANRMDEAIMLVAPSLDRRLWILDTTVTLAPLLGLFGTIIGMFHAFSVLAQPGHAPADVTAGVADALVATACGIFIAVVGLAGFNMLSNQVRLALHQLDSLKLMVLNRTDAETPAEAAGRRARQAA
jgi:biopolymer transport protein ExbB